MITVLVVEEVLDCAAVIAVVLSAAYWWRASHISHQAVGKSDTARAALNARAATTAAIAATMQALAVLSRLGEIVQQNMG